MQPFVLRIKPILKLANLSTQPLNRRFKAAQRDLFSLLELLEVLNDSFLDVSPGDCLFAKGPDPLLISDKAASEVCTPLRRWRSSPA